MNHIQIGHVEAIFRYPVKSMRGERLDVADLGWHGLDVFGKNLATEVDWRSDRPYSSVRRLHTKLRLISDVETQLLSAARLRSACSTVRWG